MELHIQINSERAHKAMTKLLLGKPGGLIPLCSKDPSRVKMQPDTATTIVFQGKQLRVYVGCLVSNIDTRDLWIMTYLQSMK